MCHGSVLFEDVEFNQVHARPSFSREAFILLSVRKLLQEINKNPQTRSLTRHPIKKIDESDKNCH